MRTKIVITVFLGLLLVFVTVGVVLPKDEQSGIDENRALKEMPDITAENIFSGQFSKEFEEYLSDNVGFRSKLTSLSAKINSYKGIKTNLGKIVSVKKDLGAGGMSDETTQLLVLEDRIMEIFSDKEKTSYEYSKAVNKYADAFADKVNVYSMLVPTQIEFEKPVYANASDSQINAITRIYDALDSRIKTVNAYDAMKENINEYIYFRTDHHWTQLGAYYGYKAYAKTADRTSIDIETQTINSKEGFFGFLYNQANEKSLSDKPDTIQWVEPLENYEFTAYAKEADGIISYPGKIYATEEESPKYSLFMGGDHSFAEIETDVKTGGTVLVIKDSYANALIPLMTNDYERILVVDPRSYYGTVDDIIEKYEVDDLLILNYVFTTTFDDYVEKLDSICK